MLDDPEDPEITHALSALIEQGVLLPGTDAHHVAQKWVLYGYDAIHPLELSSLTRALVPLLRKSHCSICGEAIEVHDLPAYLADGEGRCAKHRPNRESFVPRHAKTRKNR